MDYLVMLIYNQFKEAFKRPKLSLIQTQSKKTKKKTRKGDSGRRVGLSFSYQDKKISYINLPKALAGRQSRLERSSDSRERFRCVFYVLITFHATASPPGKLHFLN